MDVLDPLTLGQVASPGFDYTDPPVYHRHEWRPLFDFGNGEIYAICIADGCAARMNEAEITAILNGGMRLTDE